MITFSSIPTALIGCGQVTNSVSIECDRCHVPFDEHVTAAYAELPTGRNAQSEQWYLCPTCKGVLDKLLGDQVGRLRAYVAGGSTGRAVWPQISTHAANATNTNLAPGMIFDIDDFTK